MPPKNPSSSSSSGGRRASSSSASLSWFSKFLIFGVLFVAIFLGALAADVGLRHIFFGKLWLVMGNDVTTRVQPYRQSVIKSIDSLPNEELKILEIGPGTGENLLLLNHLSKSDKISWTGVEPNPVLFEVLERKINEKRIPTLSQGDDQVESFEQLKFSEARALHSFAEEFFLTSEENSYDIIISTLVLCSVSDQKSILSQLHRLLKPNKQGRLIFLEHIGCSKETHPFLRKFQEIFTPLWRLVGGGCELARDTENAILEAGLTDLSVERTQVSVFAGLLPLPLVYGVAYKP